MLATNWHHIQAPIEAPEPYDTDAAIEYATQILIDRYSADTEYVSDAMGGISASEWTVIELAVMAHDDMKAGRALREAVARVIREQASTDAAKNFRRILRDLED